MIGGYRACVWTLVAAVGGCADPTSTPISTVTFAVSCSVDEVVGGVLTKVDGGHTHPPDPVPAQYRLMSNPYGYDDPALASIGADIYASHCVPCHGADGHGKGPLAERYCPRPTDLHESNRLHEDAYLVWRIHDGGSLSDFQTAMPAYGGTLDDDAVWRIITTIRWQFIDFLSRDRS